MCCFIYSKKYISLTCVYINCKIIDIMTYRKKRRFVHLHVHNPGICHFNRGFSYSCVFFTCGLGIFLFFVSLILFFIFFSRPCSTDSQCQMKNPCSLDTCTNGWCAHKLIENCCVSDSDCGDQNCFISFCDTFRHVCQARPKKNGSSCHTGNSCSIDEVCHSGKCVGKSLTCELNNQCKTGICKGGIGCVFTNKPNGMSCDDSNPCTYEDECYNGMCAVGYAKDCSHVDNQCAIGACDVTTGGCVALATNEGKPCDDGLVCTDLDICVQGTCKGTPKTCQDNNPCTINACVESIGCMIRHEDYNETCIPGCIENTDCPTAYNCFDGTCVETQNIEAQHIRMIGYEIDDCPVDTEKKLELHFVLDTMQFTIGNEKRYRVVLSVNDIEVHPLYAGLGFGKEITNLAHNDFGNNIARTSFTIATECHRFDETNCALLFSNRYFRFASYVRDCIDINNPVPNQCINPMHVIWSSVSISISSCTNFHGQTTVNQHRGEAVVVYENTYYYKGLNNINIKADDQYGFLGIETSIFQYEGIYAVIQDMRICQTKSDHYLAACVDGTNHSMCYNTGCFDWDPQDLPLSYQVDLVVGGQVTSIARSNTFLASGCYDNDLYDSTDEQICTWVKCDRLGLDDSFKFKFKTLGELVTVNGQDNVFVFDVRYKLVFCNSTNTTAEIRYSSNKISLV